MSGVVPCAVHSPRPIVRLVSNHPNTIDIYYRVFYPYRVPAIGLTPWPPPLSVTPPWWVVSRSKGRVQSEL